MTLLPGTIWTATSDTKPTVGVVVIGYFEDHNVARVKAVANSTGRPEWHLVGAQNDYLAPLKQGPIYWAHTPTNEYA